MKFKSLSQARDVRPGWSRLDDRPTLKLCFPLQARIAVQGELLNYNTLEAFKTANHATLLQEAARKIWSDIKSGAAEQDPALLCRFLLLSHAELKTYRFYYW